jgi:hypothetical protein
MTQKIIDSSLMIKYLPRGFFLIDMWVDVVLFAISYKEIFPKPIQRYLSYHVI